jgi:hypothetical protein
VEAQVLATRQDDRQRAHLGWTAPWSKAFKPMPPALNQPTTCLKLDG